MITPAALTLREAAGFPPIPGARIERYLVPARRDLGEPTVARLWAAGAELSADEAVALALGANRPGSGEGAAADGSGGTACRRPQRTSMKGFVTGFWVKTGPPGDREEAARRAAARPKFPAFASSRK